MKVLISADMEGTCGVVSWVQVMPPEYGGEPSSQVEYERARLRMTREVNAAIEGALARDEVDEVIVNDSHNGMRNLVPEDLDPRCRFISGNDKPLGMMQGVDLEGVEVAFFTGYHAKAGTPGGPLAHTWTGWVQDVRFDGRSTGEFGINAAVAGAFGVPVVMVAGDKLAVDQTVAWCGERCVGVPVKEGFTTFSAIHEHPTKAQAMIRQGAQDAFAWTYKPKPYVFPTGATVEVDLDHQNRADHAAMVPTVDRAGERTVSFRPADGIELIHTFRAIIQAAAVRMSP